MRISDWSSDVCSSDLLKIGARAGGPGYATDPCSRVASNIGELSQLGDSERLQEELRRKRDLCDCRAPRMHNAAMRQPNEPALDLSPSPGDEVKTTTCYMCEIGTASCRERVCQ